MHINLYPCFTLTKGLRQKEVHTRGASLVFISSVAGYKGETGLSIYTASKSAIIGITRELAMELIRDGIRVNAVAPALVHTELTDSAINLIPNYIETQKAKHPLGIGLPRDVAHAIAFLLAETGRWITGTTLVVDGGYTAQ